MIGTLGINQEITADGVTLRIAGALVAGRRADRLIRTVHRLLRRGNGVVTLDLANVRIIDCAGIGLLVRCREAARRHGASLRLAGAHGSVSEMLRMSALCDAPLLITA